MSAFTFDPTGAEVTLSCFVAIATAAIVQFCGRRWCRSSVADMFGMLRRIRGAATVRRTLPWWIRAALPLATPLALWLGPRMPQFARSAVQDVLRRAGLDEDLAPQKFIAVCIVVSVASAALLSPLRPQWLAVLLWSVSLWLPWIWLRDVARWRAGEVLRELPVYIDMLTLALEAGGALSVALRVATERSPDTVLRRAFLRVQGDLRAGRTRSEALQALGERLDVPSLRPLVAALVQADASGGSFVAVLRAQADQRLEERFARAEKLAMEAPVKMLLPLVLCIFPCTFIVLAVPIIGRFLSGF